MRLRLNVASALTTSAIVVGTLSVVDARPCPPKPNGAAAWIYVAVVPKLAKGECDPGKLVHPNVKYEMPLHSAEQAASDDSPCFVVPAPATAQEMGIYCGAFGFQRNLKTVTTAELNSRSYQKPSSPFECPIIHRPQGFLTQDCTVRPITDFAQSERTQYIRSFIAEAQASGMTFDAASDELMKQSRSGLVARDVLRAYTSATCDSKCLSNPDFKALPTEQRVWIVRRSGDIVSEDKRDALADVLQQSQKPHSRVAVEILNDENLPPLPKATSEDSWHRFEAVVRDSKLGQVYNVTDVKGAVREIRAASMKISDGG